MGKVNDAYKAKYGVVARGILRTWLNVDPDPIIAAQEARLGEQDPLLDMLGLPQATAEDFAECAYWEIIKAIQSTFFGRMPRAQAVAIANALNTFPDASITFCEELTYNAWTLADAWNDAHPDEPKIQYAGDPGMP